MVRFRMHTFVAVPSGPYAVGEHAVALMCSLKLSSKLGLTSRKAVCSGWWPPIWVLFSFFKCKFPNFDCFPSYFNQELYRFLGDWWAGAKKGHIQIDLSSLSPRISKLDFTQESKYHKVIPKCSHGKLRITRHNDWHLGYGISLGKAVSFEHSGLWWSPNSTRAVRKDIAWQESRHHWHRHALYMMRDGLEFVCVFLVWSNEPTVFNICHAVETFFEWLIKGRKPMVAVQNQTL